MIATDAPQSNLRIAVVGGGHLGTIHARLLQQVLGAELAGIVEPSQKRAVELADSFDCDIECDFDKFLRTTSVDGVVLAAPTTLHHDLGVRLLESGLHCLIEKPLAPSVAECDALVQAAERHDRILQVGHVERFNPVWTKLNNKLESFGSNRVPRFIEATREGPLTFRSLDAGVVLDLMIHDIDLVLSLVDSQAISVQASGFHWTGDAEDVALARVTFANGCVARFTCSRVATKPKRSMRIHGTDWFSELDFGTRECTVVRAPVDRDWQTRGYTPDERQHLIDAMYDEVLTKDEIEIPEANPILDELTDFTRSIRSGTQPTVNGHSGLAAVDIAQQVIQRVGIRPSSRQLPLPTFGPGHRKAG